MAGGLDFKDARNLENRNASHAKTSISPLRVLKTSSLETRQKPPTLPVPGFRFPRGGPKIAQDAEKTDFLRLRFLVEISIPRRDPQNRRFWRPGRVPGCPGVPFWSHFGCFGGSLRSCFSRRFFAPFFGRFFVDFCNSSVAASILGVLPHRPRTLYFTYDSAHPHFAADLALQDFPA